VCVCVCVCVYMHIYICIDANGPTIIHTGSESEGPG